MSRYERNTKGYLTYFGGLRTKQSPIQLSNFKLDKAMEQIIMDIPYYQLHAQNHKGLLQHQHRQHEVKGYF